ncbi:hypothetical protein [Cyclobacterium qasimii]|uniref:hypothetical protein n=1 Tax=Cyclobacterium qasimii TaxID=1350429 RepID=UPI00147836D5|nr:hypothetical protein [Cyclobacterium qasimii]
MALQMRAGWILDYRTLSGAEGVGISDTLTFGFDSAQPPVGLPSENRVIADHY